MRCTCREGGEHGMIFGRFIVVVFALLLFGLGGEAQEVGPDNGNDGRNLRPRRLYFGAPPAAPHETGGFMSDCLLCHGPSSFAPETPHPTRIACRQCHVSGATDIIPFRSSRFIGLSRPPRSARLGPEGPPLMAHSPLLHENCLACHAPGAREAVISTPHPERTRCQQCHLPQGANAPEFRPTQ